MQQARFYEKVRGSSVRCTLCPHRCLIADGKTGICGVRKNYGGTLMSLVWARSVAANVDPIEKKPLFHFLPGSRSFSIATVGCNMRCAFCQNSDISQYAVETGSVTGDVFPPEAVAASAVRAGCRSISYTYTEPTVYLEYALDTAALAREKGLYNILVTNGYTSVEVVASACKHLVDAANIDLKAFTESFYKRLCSARLAPVLDAIRAYFDAGVWIEITTLVIPGENDSDAELRDIASFICSLSPDIPWHVSRYYPRHLYDKAPPTPVKTLERAREIGLSQGLHFVYTGNVAGHEGEHTVCPGCRNVVIARRGFTVESMNLSGSACAACGRTIPGKFTEPRVIPH
ncbi:MAG TPA: AmmeMemoRadiSam system radical SAM enzyme [Deltaproteobacteria bacterium]|nr:AmmeMemoRadiSam system radical SAM enzyme [Deltaproteobacteria bacterium]HOM28669.1 AmmeMemoRadiSam system radical SAM enzyme [Deltaproteobacteria bacterium]HPP80462.1 AmmeMemoRadiSam system radical SAM enzyme [Deltaproteobacteria bacterium]